MNFIVKFLKQYITEIGIIKLILRMSSSKTCDIVYNKINYGTISKMRDVYYTYEVSEIRFNFKKYFYIKKNMININNNYGYNNNINYLYTSIYDINIKIYSYMKYIYENYNVGGKKIKIEITNMKNNIFVF